MQLAIAFLGGLAALAASGLFGQLVLVQLAVLDLAFFVSFLAAGVRRLHDTGRSGLWQLLILVPLLGIVALLILQFQDSERTANKYGPSRKY